MSPMGCKKTEGFDPQSRVLWIDNRQPLEAGDRAEILIGANEVINRSGLMSPANPRAFLGWPLRDLVS